MVEAVEVIVVVVAIGSRKVNVVARIVRQVVEVSVKVMRGEPNITKVRVEGVLVKLEGKATGKITNVMMANNSSRTNVDPRPLPLSIKLSK